MRLLSLASVLGLIFLASCSSWMSGLKNAMIGEEDVRVAQNREPASNKVEIDNRTGYDMTPKERDNRVGPDLAKNEFSSQFDDNRSSQGFRGKANPWDGIGNLNEGSLWRDDVQDNFYFSRNLLHDVGDILVVQVDPEINEALNLKIAQIVGKNSVRSVVADEVANDVDKKVSDEVSKVVGNDRVGAAVGDVARRRTVDAIDPTTSFIDVDNVTVRIVEDLGRGSWRIEGSQRVFIKKAPYRLKLSGIVREEDIGTSKLIASNQILESKVELTR